MRTELFSILLDVSKFREDKIGRGQIQAAKLCSQLYAFVWFRFLGLEVNNVFKYFGCSILLLMLRYASQISYLVVERKNEVSRVGNGSCLLGEPTIRFDQVGPSNTSHKSLRRSLFLN